MTYNVFGGTLNLTLSLLNCATVWYFVCLCYYYSTDVTAVMQLL